MAKKDSKELLSTARDRFKKCTSDAQETKNRRDATADLKFLHVPGEQWDEALKIERGIRPCYEFNALRVTIKRIVNDIRANRPVGKVRAVEDGDKDTADTLEGLCRNIWTVSDADAAVDITGEYSVGGGMGAWRLTTKYSTDDAWDQDIVIEPIRNPFVVWSDCSAKDPMKRDARYWFVESRMPKDVYEEKYGKVPAVDWESSEFDDEEWSDEESVRICEYWYKRPVTKTLLLLSSGETIDAAEMPESPPVGPDGAPVSVVRQREVQTHQICMAIISGDKVLEGPTDWAGSKFPFVVVYGEHIVVDGKVYWFGLTRFAKDSQRAYNLERTLFIETEAKAPLDTDWATVKQAEGLTDQWARAHKELLPFRLYNPDPLVAGPPVRSPGAQVPPALVTGLQFSAEDIKRTTGVFDPSLSAKTNATSGVAKRAEIAQGELVCFNYPDNIARAVRYTWELMVDLIPKVYDTERTVRVLGADGAEKYARLNSRDPETGQMMNDLSRGKFDATVTVGPNMGTQRQEAAEFYMGMGQSYPPLMAAGGDLIMKSLDYPYSQEMAERLLAIAPPQIQQMLAQKEQGNGKAMDPRAMAAMAQAEQMIQMVQQQSQLVQQAAQEAEQLKGDAEKAKSDLQVQAAQLQTEAANLQAQYEKLKADLIAREAAIEVRIAQAQSEQERNQAQSEADKAKGDADKAVKQIQAQADRFIQKTYEMLAKPE